MSAVRDTDVTVTGARVRFRPVTLDHPFVISGRPIAGFTVAEVHLEVRDRRGGTAEGTGATVLSVPWAWPRAGVTPERRDEVLRGLTEELASAVVGRPPADPIALWRQLDADLGARLVAERRDGTGPVPRLAGLLALGAVDNAVHDAWARAAGLPATAMYGPGYLGSDLAWLDPVLAGQYPGDHLRPAEPVLTVQHVVGLGDPLTADDDGAERPLQDWLTAEGVTALKVKVAGQDPDADARRVVAVHAAAAAVAGAVQLSVDPNEGYAGPAEALAMLDAVARLDPDAAAAMTYLEQPLPRDATPDPEGMARLSARLPVLLDEGFTDVTALPHVRRLGWSGVVVKAAKGQTPALLAHSYARATGLALAVQDLTTVDLALAHSVRLTASLLPTWDHLEYNSRQYAPDANAELARRHPRLVQVRDGAVEHPLADVPGLYQLDEAGAR